MTLVIISAYCHASDLCFDAEIMDDVESGIKGDVCTEDNLVLVADTMDVVDSPPEVLKPYVIQNHFSHVLQICLRVSLVRVILIRVLSSAHDDDLSGDNMSQTLAEWVRQHNISSSAVNTLLHILHAYHRALPLEYRTLLGTVRTVVVRDL